MWSLLNVDRPLQQAEQAHPEGAAFMTCVRTVTGNTKHGAATGVRRKNRHLCASS